MPNAAIMYHLELNDSSTSTDLICNLYVDNVVSGCHNEEAAVDYFIQSRSILGKVNFNLRSWVSNNQQLNTTAQAHNVLDDTNPVKVLGLWWDTHSDMVFASPKHDDAVSTMLATKCEILKWTSSIFDPLGLISSVIITTKLFLQSLWQQNLNWDSQLNEDLSKTWFDITINITQATAMAFPCQCINMVISTDLKLHIFTDASPHAYGAVTARQPY